MTKLDEALDVLGWKGGGLYPWDGTNVNKLIVVISAAQQYAALLKLAPEIGNLVDVCGEHPPIEDCYAVKDFLIGNGSALYFARPTLKAIHDNLTTFGKDHSHE